MDDYFFEKGKFTEEQLEQAIIELFQLQGYTYVHGENIHRQYEDILLEDDLRSYLLSKYNDLSVMISQKLLCILITLTMSIWETIFLRL